ncbi:replicative DNA helicase [Candidatus Woesebacteria bacterium]|nr:replicative DNA helicase [Candidatus Woesebacteria bacterium]
MADPARVPPHDEAAEKSILGSILLDKEGLIKIAEFLRPEYFYNPHHEVIYATIVELFEEGSPIDVVTLSNKLTAKKKLKRVGGAEYLTELVNSVPTVSHVESYAHIVKDLSLRRQIIAASADINELGFKSEMDIKDVLDQVEGKVFSISQSGLNVRFTHVKDILKEVFEQAEKAASSDASEALGVPTGFTELDNMTGGFQKSDLIIIAARPSVGKTSLALDIARHAAVKEQKSIALFSLEMSKLQLMQRIVSMQAKVSFWDMRTGNLPDKAFDRLANVMGVLADTRLFIDDTPGQNIMEIKAKSRRLAMEHGVDMVIVDYLQLIRGRSLENRSLEVGEISMELKNLARELNIPVISLSQLNRAVENRTEKIPMLSDLRESGSIEQDADIVMFIHREDRYDENTDRKGEADLIVAKHRNGPTGRVTLAFVEQLASFQNLTKRSGEGAS